MKLRFLDVCDNSSIQKIKEAPNCLTWVSLNDEASDADTVSVPIGSFCFVSHETELLKRKFPPLIVFYSLKSEVKNTVLSKKIEREVWHAAIEWI